MKLKISNFYSLYIINFLQTNFLKCEKEIDNEIYEIYLMVENTIKNVYFKNKKTFFKKKIILKDRSKKINKCDCNIFFPFSKKYLKYTDLNYIIDVLIKEKIDIKNEYFLLWSGGVDSTLILSFLYKHNYNFKVIYSDETIKEQKNLYNYLKNKNIIFIHYSNFGFNIFKKMINSVFLSGANGDTIYNGFDYINNNLEIDYKFKNIFEKLFEIKINDDETYLNSVFNIFFSEYTVFLNSLIGLFENINHISFFDLNLFLGFFIKKVLLKENKKEKIYKEEFQKYIRNVFKDKYLYKEKTPSLTSEKLFSFDNEIFRRFLSDERIIK